MLRRMKLAFSHLQHTFRQGFKGTLNPLYYGSMKAKTITHYFLRCHFYTSKLATIMNDLPLKILPLSLLQLVITILLVFFYLVMISSMTQ